MREKEIHDESKRYDDVFVRPLFDRKPRLNKPPFDFSLDLVIQWHSGGIGVDPQGPTCVGSKL